MPAPFTRRNFIYANSVALLSTHIASQAAQNAAAAGTAAGAAAAPESTKTVQTKLAPWVRWDERERKQVNAALDQSSIFYWAGRTHNKQTALFIERFKEHRPATHVHTCSSGTAAVHIAVAAAGIGPGDEVITTPVTDIGTVSGVLFQQGVPVFADLDPGTYNIDPKSVERCITPKTKAIIAVHLAGTPADLRPLKALADKHNLILIEDCAQAWGAQYQGKPVGSIGHLACYSLMNGKHIGTGDGGVVTSNDPKIGPKLLMYGDKGADRPSADWAWAKTAVLATNYRMSELQAAFGAVQLQRVEEIAAKRAALGKILSEIIADIPGLTPPKLNAGDRSSYWFYYFRMQPNRFKISRNAFATALRAEGVSCAPGYVAVPLYKLPYFQQHGFFSGRWPIKELGLTSIDYTKVKCPEAEAILETGINCILNESMNETYIREVGAAIRKVAKANAA